MRVHHMQVSLGTSDKGELADFYSRLLDGNVTWKHPPSSGDEQGSGWVHLDVDTEAGGFRINFEHDDEWQPPTWPSEPGAQNITQHLCVFVYDLDAAVHHAEQCGATRDPNQFVDIIRVMRDPQGHPFCLILADEG